jgi:hypothetical protein
MRRYHGDNNGCEPTVIGFGTGTLGTLHHLFTIGGASLATSRCFVLNVGHDKRLEAVRTIVAGNPIFNIPRVSLVLPTDPSFEGVNSCRCPQTKRSLP